VAKKTLGETLPEVKEKIHGLLMLNHGPAYNWGCGVLKLNRRLVGNGAMWTLADFLILVRGG